MAKNATIHERTRSTTVVQEATMQIGTRSAVSRMNRTEIPSTPT